MTLDAIKQAWQASVEIAGPLPLDDLRKGADKLYRRVKRRNIVEYVACVVAIAIFAFNIFTMPHILQKVGSAMLVAAAIYAPWQLHRRASAVATESAGALPIYDFLRGQLVRQRDALKGIFGWYILPFLPGVSLVLVGNGLHAGSEEAGPPIWLRWLVPAGVLLFIGFATWINRVAARRLQKHIDEIDVLTGRTE